jgi:hypothetical protein
MLGTNNKVEAQQQGRSPTTVAQYQQQWPNTCFRKVLHLGYRASFVMYFPEGALT